MSGSECYVNEISDWKKINTELIPFTTMVCDISSSGSGDHKQGSPFCWDAEAAGPAVLGQNLSKISASQPNLSKISASDQKSSL